MRIIADLPPKRKSYFRKIILNY